MFSLAELDHYRRVLATCHENGIRPMVTFHHFTTPRWVMAYGGWEGQDTPDKFARYCERAAKHLGDLITSACTLNEANIGRLITGSGFVPPPEVLQQAPGWVAAARTLGIAPNQLNTFMLASSPRAVDTMLKAHRRGFEAIKSALWQLPRRHHAGLARHSGCPGWRVGSATDENSHRIKHITCNTWSRLVMELAANTARRDNPRSSSK